MLAISMLIFEYGYYYTGMLILEYSYYYIGMLIFESADI